MADDPRADRVVELSRGSLRNVFTDVGEDEKRAGRHDRDQRPEGDQLSKPIPHASCAGRLDRSDFRHEAARMAAAASMILGFERFLIFALSFVR